MHLISTQVDALRRRAGTWQKYELGGFISDTVGRLATSASSKDAYSKTRGGGAWQVYGVLLRYERSHHISKRQMHSRMSTAQDVCTVHTMAIIDFDVR
jgi:hypothetical protein